MTLSNGIAPSRRSPTQIERTSPTRPPAAARTRLSVNVCRIRRPRPAPSARRTAISFCRAEARLRSRFATLAHAISRTRPTIAINTRSGVSTPWRKSESPRAAGSSVICLARKRSLNSSDPEAKAGTAVSSCSLTCRYSTSNRALAASAVTPGLSRPMTLTQRLRRLSRSSHVGVSFAFIINGTNKSGDCVAATPENRAGATPTIVIGVLLIVTA